MSRLATPWRGDQASFMRMNTKLCCADIGKGTLTRLEIHQCSQCDNFCNELCKANVSQEQYCVRFRCTRPIDEQILVRVVNSPWSTSSQGTSHEHRQCQLFARVITPILWRTTGGRALITTDHHRVTNRKRGRNITDKHWARGFAMNRSHIRPVESCRRHHHRVC
jgi:hypothetical protein